MHVAFSGVAGGNGMVARGVTDGTRCFGRCLAGAVQEGVAGGGRRDHATSVLLRPTYDPGANPGPLASSRMGLRLSSR